MRGGRLDRRIIVEKKTESVATNGQRTLTWATFLTIWGDQLQGVTESGGEQTTDNNRTTNRLVRFTTRYNSTITNEMRIKWNGEYYKIEDIKELKRQDGLLILTSKQELVRL
jgi:SPP1 family predicted phage head-tail adaptor